MDNAIDKNEGAGNADIEIMNWEASEFIKRERSAGWYAVVFGVAGVIGLISVLLQGWGSWSLLLLLGVGVVMIMLYSKQTPRILHYSLTKKGLSEGNKFYKFSDFRAFGVLRDGQDNMIILLPKSRFGLKVSAYFSEAQGEQIVDAFGNVLPMEEVHQDFLDKIVRKLKL